MIFQRYIRLLRAFEAPLSRKLATSLPLCSNCRWPLNFCNCLPYRTFTPLYDPLFYFVHLVSPNSCMRRPQSPLQARWPQMHLFCSAYFLCNSAGFCDFMGLLQASHHPQSLLSKPNPYSSWRLLSSEYGLADLFQLPELYKHCFCSEPALTPSHPILLENQGEACVYSKAVFAHCALFRGKLPIICVTFQQSGAHASSGIKCWGQFAVFGPHWAVWGHLKSLWTDRFLCFGKRGLNFPCRGAVFEGLPISKFDVQLYLLGSLKRSFRRPTDADED